jgi:TRAP-type uncharacterized transport system fused permease subunit
VGDAVLAFTAGKLIPTLIVSMIIALLLGMGMPTTASYVMGSAISAPALIMLGINPLDAHMFVFFYAVLSSVTPPVCTGAYTAAGLAGSDPNKTAFAAIKLALSGFIVPFIFVLAPEILLVHVKSWHTTLQAMVSAIIGVYLLSCASENYMMSPFRKHERAIALAGAIGLIYPGLITDVAGIIIIVFLFLVTKKRSSLEKVGADAI